MKQVREHITLYSGCFTSCVKNLPTVRRKKIKSAWHHLVSVSARYTQDTAKHLPYSLQIKQVALKWNQVKQLGSQNYDPPLQLCAAFEPLLAHFFVCYAPPSHTAPNSAVFSIAWQRKVLDNFTLHYKRSLKHQTNKWWVKMNSQLNSSERTRCLLFSW